MNAVKYEEIAISKFPELSLSVVSHGQGELVRNLLRDIAKGIDVTYEIILTLNIPEDESFIREWPTLPLSVIRNASIKGFGSNHNAAFTRARGKCFAIVNPDIRAQSFSLRPLLDILTVSDVGACGPAVYSSDMSQEDSARHFPTLSTFFKRKFFHARGLDYVGHETAIQVDWLAGMFIIFDRDAFSKVGGFDERYFMYLEDTDICRRLGLAGWRVVLQPSSKVIHDAQRFSRRSVKHLFWHLRSAFLFLTTNYRKK